MDSQPHNAVAPIPQSGDLNGGHTQTTHSHSSPAGATAKFSYDLIPAAAPTLGPPPSVISAADTTAALVGAAHSLSTSSSPLVNGDAICDSDSIKLENKQPVSELPGTQSANNVALQGPAQSSKASPKTAPSTPRKAQSSQSGTQQKALSTPKRSSDQTNAKAPSQSPASGLTMPTPDTPTSASTPGIVIKLKQPPRRPQRTFTSSLTFNPQTDSTSTLADAVAQPAKEGGMKRSDRMASRMDATSSGTGTSTPEPAHAWVAGNASSTSATEGITGPPDPSRHPSRKMAKIAPTAPLPFQTSKDDPAAKPCIPTHISSPREPIQRTRPRLFGLQDCPTFYPTWEEFEQPAKYMDWVGSPEGGNGKAYGIAKIVPPEGWNPDFVLDQERFRFRTRLQSLNSLSADARANLNYQEQLQKFHTQQGRARVQIPVIDHRPVDLYQLKLIVKQLGGYDNVCRQRSWPEVGRRLGYPEALVMHLAAQVKSAYAKIIQPFELFLIRAKEQAKSQTSPNASHSSASSNINEAKTSSHHSATATPDRDVEMFDNSNTSGGSSDLRTTFINDLRAAGMSLEEAESYAADESGQGKRRSSRKRTESTLTRQPAELHPSVKRQRRGIVASPKPTSSTSKAKDITTLAGAEEQMCEICLRGDGGTSMLLCDECDRGYHMYCLDPPLTSVPKSEWYCPPCLVSTGNDFGFDDGETHSLDSFWKRANMFRRHWFENNPRAIWSGSNDQKANQNPDGMDVDLAQSTRENGVTRPIAGTTLRVSEDDVEREFWRLVHDPDETVEVEYGADVHSTTHGSALPTLETHPNNRYSRDCWNLNNLPISGTSLLRYIKSNISGMTVPWIYVGMMFSAFCWHNEDHYTYSINYQHFGDTKTWYGVPGADAEKFEEAMRKVAPDLFETSPDLLFQLVTLMSPDKLVKEGVRVYACDQRANEFVVTYPKAYHSGFNQGFNLNEAVNFALPDWIDLDLECVRRYQKFSRAPVFSHDELIITVAQQNNALDAAVWLQEPMREMVQREVSCRDALREGIPNLQESVDESDRPEVEYQCAHCNTFCYLGQVISPSSKGVACLEHAFQVCGVDDPQKWTLRLRFTDDQLRMYQQKVADKAEQPEQWRDRLKKLLISHPRPPLRSLRNLLQEGEKIAAFLPEVADLRDFVDKANDWVNQATQLMPKRYGGRDATQSNRRRRSVIDQSPTPRQEGDDLANGQDPRANERTTEALRVLLAEVDTLPFDAPEIAVLRDSVSTLEQASDSCDDLLKRVANGETVSVDECESVLSAYKSTKADVPQLSTLEKYVAGRKWVIEMDEIAPNYINSLDVADLLAEFDNTDLPQDHTHYIDLKERMVEAENWQEKASRVISGNQDTTLKDLDELVSAPDRVPTPPELYTRIEKLLAKGRRWSEELDDIYTKTGEHVKTDADESFARAAGILREVQAARLIVPHANEMSAAVHEVMSFRRGLLKLIATDDKDEQAWSSLHQVRSQVLQFKDRLERSVNHKDNTPLPNCKGVADPYECFERMTLSHPYMTKRPVEMRCAECKTGYHRACLKLTPSEDKYLSSLSSNVLRQWKCPLCKPIDLPHLLQNRKVIPLTRLLDLASHWYPDLVGRQEIKAARFWPESVVLLVDVLRTCKRDRESIAKWLIASSDATAGKTEWFHHLLSRLMQSPVSYKVRTGDDDAVLHCARSLYQIHGLVDDEGRHPGMLPLSIRSVAKIPVSSAVLDSTKGSKKRRSNRDDSADISVEGKRKRGKRAIFTLLEERPLKESEGGANSDMIRCLCHEQKTDNRIRCKRCLEYFHIGCMKLKFENDTPPNDFKFTCPPCCTKVEKRYPHAEVKVKDLGISDPDMWLDVRSSLRSQTGPISKRQTWSAPPEERIVLHLTHYSPAVPGDLLDDDVRQQTQADASTSAIAKAAPSSSTSMSAQAASRVPSSSPQTSAQIADRVPSSSAQVVNGAPSSSVQAVANGAHTGSSLAGKVSSSSAHPASASMARSMVLDNSRSSVPAATAVSTSSNPPAGSSRQSSVRSSTSGRSPPMTANSNGDAPASASRTSSSKDPRIQTEEYKRGMQNLYNRGLTDAMIDRYSVGWNGKDLVYRHVDSATGQRTDYLLGPFVKLDEDDPDGTRVIRHALNRHHAKRHKEHHHHHHHRSSAGVESKTSANPATTSQVAHGHPTAASGSQVVSGSRPVTHDREHSHDSRERSHSNREHSHHNGAYSREHSRDYSRDHNREHHRDHNQDHSRSHHNREGHSSSVASSPPVREAVPWGHATSSSDSASQHNHNGERHHHAKSSTGVSTNGTKLTLVHSRERGSTSGNPTAANTVLPTSGVQAAPRQQ
ncbi:unnamed protein product [Sympodiomycopsis kandeliae]